MTSVEAAAGRSNGQAPSLVELLNSLRPFSRSAALCRANFATVTKDLHKEMMNHLLRTLSLGLFFVICSAQAAVYYISPSGNDSNNGTSQTTPWKTIARVQQLRYTAQPGDQFLFQRGGNFPGQLSWTSSGTSASRIVFGAYGTGAAPVINGAVPVTGWTQHSGNIYKANVSGAVQYVFVNGALQTLARFPNTGWLRNSAGSNTQVTSSGITQGSGTWTGGTIVLRSQSWCYENRVISNHSGNTVTYPSTWFNPSTDDWGFYLCNKLSQLDAAGEWYHDATAGVLYFWAPSGGNPSSLNVEASVNDFGIFAEWQRTYVTIQDLTFKGQKVAGIDLPGASYANVTGCRFEKLYYGIRSYSSYNTYNNNTFDRTYATAMELIDNNTMISNNTFTNIALEAGLGESSTGYFGMRAIGANNTVRGNRMETIGYCGIFFEGNTLVEKNVVVGAMATVNDGGGIYFDNANGAIVQDNIVRDPIGNLTSIASTVHVTFPILHGVYFGQAVIQNTIVRRNTVSNCTSGIHVDHTMVSVNNQVKDNILFNNLYQLSISDYSNYNGPGAAWPYYVANFNTVYSGNQMYSLNADQHCMYILNCYQQGNVDYGTFTNNKLYSPYNELSIYSQNLSAGNFKEYTLERWKAERNEETGSTRSPLRSTMYNTVSELSSNLILNGNFASNASGWSAWPSNSVLTRDDGYLDNGALKVTLPNSSQSSILYMVGQDQFSMQNGQWYRMRMSVQSSIHGVIETGVKTVSQLGTPGYVHVDNIPFDGERRDLELYFQSNTSEQSVGAFANNVTDNTYWLDNVELHRVTVQPRVPSQEHVLLVNDQATAQSFPLPTGCWSDMNGTMLSGNQSVAAYSSKIIYQVPGTGCNNPTASSVGAKVLLGGAMVGTTGLMRENLRQQGLIPSTEPYSALGYTVENTNAALTASLLNTTGAQSIVDWVLIELRNNDAGNTVAARRAALVRSNGEVVSTTGSAQINFNVSTIGKRMVIRHRNHLAAMANTPIAINGQIIDLTLGTTALYGTNGTMTTGTKRALWPGDVTTNGTVQYTGTGNDRDVILLGIGSVVATNTVQGYLRTDLNLNGTTSYTGVDNDRDIILTIIGGTVATNVRTAQVP